MRDKSPIRKDVVRESSINPRRMVYEPPQQKGHPSERLREVRSCNLPIQKPTLCLPEPLNLEKGGPTPKSPSPALPTVGPLVLTLPYSPQSCSFHSGAHLAEPQVHEFSIPDTIAKNSHLFENSEPDPRRIKSSFYCKSDIRFPKTRSPCSAPQPAQPHPKKNPPLNPTNILQPSTGKTAEGTFPVTRL